MAGKVGEDEVGRVMGQARGRHADQLGPCRPLLDLGFYSEDPLQGLEEKNDTLICLERITLSAGLSLNMAAMEGKGGSRDPNPGTEHHGGLDPIGIGRGGFRNETHYGKSNTCQNAHPSAHLRRGRLTNERRLSVFLGLRCSAAMVDLGSLDKSNSSSLAICHLLPTQGDLCNQDLNQDAW